MCIYFLTKCTLISCESLLYARTEQIYHANPAVLNATGPTARVQVTGTAGHWHCLALAQPWVRPAAAATVPKS